MNLTKQHLANTFRAAREMDASYVFIAISAEDVEEVIVIPRKSFDAKEAFYNRSYSDDLIHCMNSKVYIRGLNYGEAADLADII